MCLKGIGHVVDHPKFPKLGEGTNMSNEEERESSLWLKIRRNEILVFIHQHEYEPILRTLMMCIHDGMIRCIAFLSEDGPYEFKGKRKGTREVIE